MSNGLPSVIPLFPLSGVIFFPDSQLPLNVFEPRYKALVEDTLEDRALIGIIQPRAAGYEPPLYEVGCVGRIVSSKQTEDGRYLITLAGLARFRLVEELARTTAYRQARVDYGSLGASDDGALSHEERARLISALRRYLTTLDLDIEWESLDLVDDSTLVDALGMLCPFDAAEKQALLEAPGCAARADALIALLEFAAAGGAEQERH